MLGNQKTCVIEMASASGITLLHNNERNPRVASSYGTGQLIKYALDQGFRDFIICIGGVPQTMEVLECSEHLGFVYWTEMDVMYKNIDGLFDIRSLDFSNWDARLADSKIAIACDVDNPLVGEKGASAIFGPQKGVQEGEVLYFDQALTYFADVVEKEKGIRLHDYKGAGAAGGMGGALIAFLNGKFQQGIQLVLDVMKYGEKFRGQILSSLGKGNRIVKRCMGKRLMEF